MNSAHTADQWNPFVVSHPQGHILQTTAWAQLKSEFGWSAEQIPLKREGQICAGAQVLFRPLPLGRTIAYVPKGPLVDWQDAALCQELFTALHQRCRERHAILLKIEPDVNDDPTLEQRFARWRFQPSAQTVQPRRSILIDTTLDENQILTGMKSKTRYNIRLADRKGVQIRQGRDDDLDAFTHLMTVTGQRNEFGVHSAHYYKRAYALLAPLHMARLFLATYDGQPIAGVMALTCGPKAWNMFSASANQHREKMPNYALQWAAICWAKTRGCATYDLWGVPDHDEQTLESQFAERNDGMWGLYRFKRGFGGTLVRYAGAFDYVYSKPLYALYRLALRMR
jgi:peptidoglycan pentaglycine glycine transferase (the first glycine)